MDARAPTPEELETLLEDAFVLHDEQRCRNSWTRRTAARP